MQKVITINLNGNAYQIDDTGFDALVAYLDGAQRQLLDNPDRLEIVADLEQAIADKCRAFLGAHKTVVSAAEVAQIIREMGPVDGAGSPGAAGDASAPRPGAAGQAPGASAPKRLYLVHEGAMLAGVCAGVAAYLHVDVTVIRIAFVLLAIVSKGGFGLAYLVLAFVIPSADTSEERAAARGEPFNAQELIDRAKRNYAAFTGGRDWRREWRQQHRAWRAQWRASRWHARGHYGYPMAGLRAAMLTVVCTILVWFWAWTMFSLVIRGRAFGQTWPDDLPPWLGIVALVVLFQLIAWPLRVARRRTYYAPGIAHYWDGPLAALGGLMSIAFWVVAGWLAYAFVPEFREIMRALPDIARSFGI